MLSMSTSSVVKVVLSAALFAVCAILSVNGQPPSIDADAWRCPMQAARYGYGSGENIRHAGCAKFVYFAHPIYRSRLTFPTFFEARRLCRALPGHFHINYFRSKEEAEKQMQFQKNWLGIWTKNNKTVWDLTRREIKPGDFHMFTEFPKGPELKCAYTVNSTKWKWGDCNNKIMGRCFMKAPMAPGIPTISFTASYRGARLADLTEGDNLRVECRAFKGEWGELLIILQSDFEDPLIFGQGHPNTSLQAVPIEDRLQETLTLYLDPVDDYDGCTILCFSDLEENTTTECTPSNVDCVILGKIEVAPGPNVTLPEPLVISTTQAPTKKPESWLKPAVRVALVSLAVGFFIGLIIGPIILKIYLRSQRSPMLGGSQGKDRKDDNTIQEADVEERPRHFSRASNKSTTL